MDDLIERMRSLEQDHEPEGWPAVQMRDISALCDALEAARIQDVSHGWKAVLVEPNSEMVDAAADAYMPFGDMELAIRCAILAAPQPTAEQEPRAMTNLKPCWKCGSPGVID